MATSLARGGGLLLAARRHLAAAPPISAAASLAGFDAVAAAAPIQRRRGDDAARTTVRLFSGLSCGAPITHYSGVTTAATSSAAMMASSSSSLTAAATPAPRTFGSSPSSRRYDKIPEPTPAEIAAQRAVFDDDDDLDVNALFSGGDDGGPVVNPAAAAAAGQDGGPPKGLFTSPIGENYAAMSNDELSNHGTIPGFHLVSCPPRKHPRGALVGTVVSDKMDKTVNVAVDRYRIVPKYRKRRKYTKKFMAHDEGEVCNMGDTVMIVPCQRISKNKHFMVREIVREKGSL